MAIEDTEIEIHFPRVHPLGGMVEHEIDNDGDALLVKCGNEVAELPVLRTRLAPALAEA